MATACKSCRLAPQLPWLMFPTSHAHSLTTENYHFLSLFEEHKLYNSNIKQTHVKCYGSVEGWLIMIGDDNIKYRYGYSFDGERERRCTVSHLNYFLNPISMDIVMLPSRRTINSDVLILSSSHKVVASSAPTSLGCLVASPSSCGRLSFCRPSDESWTLIDPKQEVLRGIELEHGSCDIEVTDKKHFVPSTGHVLVFDIQLNANGGGSHAYTAEKLVMLRTSQVSIGLVCKNCMSKELFMAIYGWIDHHTKGFQVFKLELNADGPQWIEVTDLGDPIMFLSSAGGFVIPYASGLDYYGPHGNT